jgi:hypothetical protein
MTGAKLRSMRRVIRAYEKGRASGKQLVVEGPPLSRLAIEALLLYPLPPR